MKRSLGYVLIGVISLTACGGSSNNNDSSGELTPPPVIPQGLARCDIPTELNPVATTSAITFYTEDQYLAEQPGAITVTLNGNNVSDFSFNWTQLSGPTLTLKSIKSPVLAFTARESGSYKFEVTASKNDITYIESIEINLTAASAEQLSARVDHQASEGNSVSFRLDTPETNPPTEINWCLAAGPSLTVDISTPEQALLTAPSVNEDTISILRATAVINGETVTDDVQLLITKEAAITSSYFDERVAKTFAYNADSPYKNELQPCVYSNQLQQSCNISRLPLIGQKSGIDKQAILDRVLVSHQWMGENFEHFLENLDPNSDFATLLQSVTAVVISYDVRPSFYWVVTGAIYLDPNDLWLLAQERDTINEAPDYRSAFGNDLNFLMPWRYVKNNSYTSYITPRNVRVDRTAEQMMPDLASLLYHELAHANDFFPNSVHASLSGPTLLDDYFRRSDAKQLVSDQLTALYPLNSQEMTNLAEVSFKGETANDPQKAYIAADITSFFSPDRASDYYAYSTKREDAAMLFEEALMSHRYSIQRDVAVTDKPDNPTASSISVNWGQRGRIGDAKLENRAAFVINQMMPDLDGATLVNQLPDPIAMKQGQSWADNLAISPVNNAIEKSLALSGNVSEPTFVPKLRFSGDRHTKPMD
ncbi:PKD domain-containing protein [Shewanella sp. 0m-4]